MFPARRLVLAWCVSVFLCVHPVAAVHAGPLQDGEMAYNNGDYATALRLWRPLALKGDPIAQSNLGVLYEMGRGVTQDAAEAVKWYRKSAEQGEPLGQSNLGVMYENGTGVDQDFAMAVAWYRRAAEQGYGLAQTNLGYMYENGRGVPQDFAEAVKWYRFSADQGEPRGQNNLGVMYEQGKGVTQDLAAAIAWYRKAAEQGEALAQTNLGFMYETGRGVERDDAAAVEWYRRAANQNDARAQSNLGVMYENGRGVAQNIEEGVKWYRLSAEQGDSLGQANYGLMHELGKGVPQDHAEAARWYSRSAGQDDLHGQARLANLYDKGLGVPADVNEALRLYRLASAQPDAPDWVRQGLADLERRIASGQGGAGASLRKVALVVGNNRYEHTVPLKNAANDAGKVAEALEKAGFKVVLGIDLDKIAFNRKLREFAGALEGADLSLVFYSGHGLQVDGENYLVPTDAVAEDRLSLKFEMVNARDILDGMIEQSDVTLAFFDACRNNPLSRSLAAKLGPTRSVAVGKGMAQIEVQGTGAMIAFATAPGDVALDGEGENSPFTAALLKHLATPGLEINQLMTRVKADVVKQTGGRQRPWHTSDLVDDVFLVQ